MLKRIQTVIRKGILWTLAVLVLSSCQDNFKTVGIISSATRSSISLSTTTTTQNSVVTVTIWLKDADGLAIAGVRPTLSVSPTGASVSACSVSSAAGLSTCTISSTTATTYTVAMATPVSLSAGTLTVYSAPTSLTFATQPSTIISNVVFASNVAVNVYDANGALATALAPGTVVTLTITGTDSTAVMTLGGIPCAVSGCTQTVVAGTATFTNLTVDKVGLYNLVATVSPATRTSSSFNVNYAAASQIAFTTQPSSSVVRNRLMTQMPIVKIQDAQGNTVTGHATDSVATVTLSLIGCGGGTLISDAVVATGGVANFANAGIRLRAAAAQVGCQLQASATLLGPGAVTANSSTFTISVPGATTALSLTSSTPSAAANVVFDAQPTVAIVDAAGVIDTNDYTTSVTISKSASSTGSGLLNGTTTATAVAGLVTFSGLYFDLAGIYGMTATSGALTSANSSTFTVSALGSASRLSLSTQPVDSAVSTTLQPSPLAVRILDANGNLVNTSTATVTATLATGTGTLGGTTSVAAVAGVATFSNLNINAVGGGKSITFASSGLTSVTTSTFNVYSLGIGRYLRFVTQPAQNSTNNVAFTTQPQVEVVDEHGLRITTDNATVVTLTCQSSDGGCVGVVNNNVSPPMVSGLATFVNANFSAADTNVVIRATGGGFVPTNTKPNLRVQ